MNRKSRVLALFTVAALTLILMLALSGGPVARATFQDSPLDTPAPTTSGQPEIQPPTTPPTTSVSLTPAVGPTPTVRGFLPAPTIVNPNDLKSLPVAQPPVSVGDSEPEPDVAQPTPPPSSLAVQLAVQLVNYFWLLCIGALLIAAVVAVFLIWRRDRHI